MAPETQGKQGLEGLVSVGPGETSPLLSEATCNSIPHLVI